MTKSQKAIRKKFGGRGPLARKVIASAQRYLQSKVINLAEWRDAKVRAEDFQKTIISPNDLTQYDPIHGLYIYGQNQLSVLIEQLSGLPMLDKLADAYAEAHEEYVPSGPPMSPLTPSYFACWGSFDLCHGGAKKESLGTVAIDFCRYMNMDEGLIAVFEKMQESRMGIYKHEGMSGNYVTIKELVTNKKIKVLSTSGYQGRPGEIWYTRILPPPFEGTSMDYSIVFTTPYVLGKNGSRNEFIPFVETDWLEYFERNLKMIKADNIALAYENLMKYGLSKNYWNEFVFLSYRNHRHDMIFLEGIPDIPSSMPHTEEGRGKLDL